MQEEHRQQEDGEEEPREGTRQDTFLMQVLLPCSGCLMQAGCDEKSTPSFWAASAAACKEAGRRCARGCSCLKGFPKSDRESWFPLSLRCRCVQVTAVGSLSSCLFPLVHGFTYASFLCLPIKNKQTEEPSFLEHLLLQGFFFFSLEQLFGAV